MFHSSKSCRATDISFGSAQKDPGNDDNVGCIVKNAAAVAVIIIVVHYAILSLEIVPAQVVHKVAIVAGAEADTPAQTAPCLATDNHYPSPLPARVF